MPELPSSPNGSSGTRIERSLTHVDRAGPAEDLAHLLRPEHDIVLVRLDAIGQSEAASSSGQRGVG